MWTCFIKKKLIFALQLEGCSSQALMLVFCYPLLLLSFSGPGAGQDLLGLSESSRISHIKLSKKAG